MRPAVLLLLAAFSAAEEEPIARVLDPRAVSLAPVEWARYRKLDRAERLRVKGLDPASWLDAQMGPDLAAQTSDWVEERYGFRAGFRFDDRLAVKRRLALRLLEGKDASYLRPLVERLGEEWRRFEEPVLRLEEELRKAAPKGNYRTASSDHREWLERNKERFAKLQALLALRRSELDFHGWLAREVGARFAGKEAATGTVANGLASESPRVRLFCAELLAERGAGAGEILRGAIAREPSAPVAARMVELLGRADPLGPAAALDDPRWQVRAAAIAETGRIATPGSTELLLGRLLLEDGRLEGDVQEALGDAAPPRRRPRVEFFGIGTGSRRVVFCLDVSPSMTFALNRATPMPRFDVARRELRLTLDHMPADVRFGIVTFHGRTARLRPGLVPATAENKAEARAFLDGMTFDEMGTNLFDAVLECLDELGPPAEPFDADTVYVLSDGASSMGPLIETGDLVAELALRMRGRRVVLHTIGVSMDQNAELLSNLARITGGRYVDVCE